MVAASIYYFIYIQKIFRMVIVKALATVPEDRYQRVDGLRCEKHVIDYKFDFFEFRMRFLVREGLVKTIPSRSWWPSCDGMPCYALTDKGRELYASYIHTS